MSDPKHEPQNQAPTGRTIREIERLAGFRLGGRVRDFRISVQDGGLVLNGSANSYYAKQIAQHLVIDLSGMPILANEIKVGSR